MATIPLSFTQQVKVAMAVVTNESTAITILTWLISNALFSQSITDSHGSHAAY